ncbi:MAG: MmcQ/YjbR family DNA-binding protein [Acidobacteria bacterium]|nr:MmcQ/YjbR family DNA-binding protein [Acidobacteriota bacterium]
MTASGFRKLALKMPEATEGSHFGNADFRIENKIFATLAYEKKGFGVLMLAPEQQQGMIADAPEIFVPVPNAWGKQGATMVKLSAVKPDILESALRTAWLRRAPKRLLDPKR